VLVIPADSSLFYPEPPYLCLLRESGMVAERLSSPSACRTSRPVDEAVARVRTSSDGSETRTVSDGSAETRTVRDTPKTRTCSDGPETRTCLGGASDAVWSLQRVTELRRPTCPLSTPRALPLHTISPHWSAVAFLLFSSLLWPTLAAPAPRKAHWRNPCSLDLSRLDRLGVPATARSDANIIDSVLHLNSRLRPKLDQLMTEFVNTKYHNSRAEMEQDWGHHHLDWLSFVGRTIERQGERLAADTETPLQLEGVLRTHFADLQRLAMGFERTTLEAALFGDESLDDFRHLQTDLINKLLCELHLGLLEKGLTPEEAAVSEEVLGEAPRERRPSRQRNLRNWVLLREYELYLAHVDDVFRALRDTAEEEGKA